MRRNTTIPFDIGEVTVGLDVESDRKDKEFRRLFDAIFGAAVRTTSSVAPELLDGLAEDFGEDGRTEGSRKYMIALAGGPSLTLELSLVLDVSLVPEVALSAVAMNIVPSVMAKALVALISVDAAPHLESSNYRERAEELAQERGAEMLAELLAAFGLSEDEPRHGRFN